MSKLILFDWGGVLCQETFHGHVMKHLNIPREQLTLAMYRAGWPAAETGIISEDEFWGELANELGLPAETIKRYAYEDLIFHDRVLELSKALKDKGHRVAILTNNLVDWFNNQARGRIDHFEHVFNSAELGTRKPEVQMYLHPLRHFGYESGNAYFIDDKIRNTEAAEALGINSFVFDKNPGELEYWLKNIGLL